MDCKTYSKENDTDARKIANLCRMCGQCCQAMATDFTYEELLTMSKEDKKEASVFIEFFDKYENIAAARKVAPGHVNQVLRYKGLSEDLEGDELPFYYCKKMLPDNACSAYNERPSCCRMAPKNGWAVMPPGCGYAGWQYEERERLKSTVRALKEKIYEVETLRGSDAFVEELNMSLSELKEYVREKAEPFKICGSAGW